MKHWNYEVWHWRRGWLRGTVEASTLSMAFRRALQQVPDYTQRLPRRGLQVTVRITRID